MLSHDDIRCAISSWTVHVYTPPGLGVRGRARALPAAVRLTTSDVSRLSLVRRSTQPARRSETRSRSRYAVALSHHRTKHHALQLHPVWVSDLGLSLRVRP
eukprot:1662204-Prymnesium_polylepis.1